jgi:hypothetical protein
MKKENIDRTKLIHAIKTNKDSLTQEWSSDVLCNDGVRNTRKILEVLNSLSSCKLNITFEENVLLIEAISRTNKFICDIILCYCTYNAVDNELDWVNNLLD